MRSSSRHGQLTHFGREHVDPVPAVAHPARHTLRPDFLPWYTVQKLSRAFPSGIRRSAVYHNIRDFTLRVLVTPEVVVGRRGLCLTNARRNARH